MRIEDYALIGDCETAALVSLDGSIDWLCVPRFDAGACFAALLGDERHGRWRIAPVGGARAVRRRYRGHTLILETEMEVDGGVVRLVDFMPPRPSAPEVVRIVEGVTGSVDVEMELVVRFDYGSIVPWARRTAYGARFSAGPDCVHLISDVEARGRDFKTLARFRVGQGDCVRFQLRYGSAFDALPGGRAPHESLAATEAFWTSWVRGCEPSGPYAEAVLRSLLVLKALTYAPTGGMVAAPTTSLPEELGGVRNWDYRYCWIRDATFVLYALVMAGFIEEADAWRRWLVNASAGTPDQLQVLYGVAGERRLPELSLPWLPGYEGSAPVRIGNDAHQQLQLDVYGELLDALYLARLSGLAPDENAWRLERTLMESLEGRWRAPDEGIWEVRGGRRHFTHSKVMAWVAADRVVKSAEALGDVADGDRWRRLRDAIHAEVCARGFNDDVGAFVQTYGSGDADASLLMLPLVGFLPADDPRILGTTRFVEERLVHDGFVLRYQPSAGADGIQGADAAFLPCSFWLADCHLLQRQRGRAEEIFETILGIRNDVGLLAEEYHPGQRRMLGNFPQAFSHVGLINTARNLAGPWGPAEHRHRHHRGRHRHPPGRSFED